METKRTLKLGSGAIVGALAVWLFLYISTIFPYLGYSSQNETLGPGVSLSAGSKDVGLTTMLLFEGQTAFIDYEVASTENGKVILDVKPISTFGFSENKQDIEAGTKGTYEVEIEKTGLYEFRHDFSLNGISGTTEYRVSWGAR
ncbi:MAG: hypothetical protein AAGK17_06165 [Pseudomonadota bacterium]